MNEEKKWMKMRWMKKNMQNNLLLNMSFSLFGMLLIFGLGFVFPDINPYVAIRWIVIVCAAVFAFSLISFVFMSYAVGKGEVDIEMGEGKPSKAKKSSKKK